MNHPRHRIALLVLLVLTAILRGAHPPASRGFAAEGDSSSQWASCAGWLPYRLAGDIWLADADAISVTPQRLTHGGSALDPALSPDGRHVAWWQASIDHAAPLTLFRADLLTGHVMAIATGAGPVVGPVWSPHGSLAWLAGQELAIADPTGEVHSLGAVDTGGIEPVHLAWAEHGASLLLPATAERARALWQIDVTDGTRRRLLSLADDGPVVAAVAQDNRVALARADTLHLFTNLESMARGHGEIVALGAPLAHMAWSVDGTTLAAAGVDGRLYWGKPGEDALHPLAAPEGFITRVAWLDDGRLAVRAVSGTAGGETLYVVEWADSPAPAWRRISPDTALAGPITLRMPSGAVTTSAERPYDWYRYQGSADSGPMASNNCGPTCVAMSIQFARNNMWVPIRDIRTFMGGSSWTYPAQLQAALDQWGVANQRLYTWDEVRDAVQVRGSVVLVHLWMYYMTPGSDYMLAYSDPALRYGRYYAYDQSHWAVLKGFTADGQWAICHDPNVWDGNGVYWHSGSLPKGRDRYYRTDQLAGSIAAYSYQVVEVFDPGAAVPTATPAASPTSTQTPSTPTPTPTPVTRPGAELVRNPGFEAEGDWTFPSTPARGQRSRVAFHSGEWSALLGLVPGQSDVFSYSTAHQRIIIPADADQVRLSLWYLPGTEETTGVAARAIWDGYTPLVEGAMPRRPASNDALLWSNADWQRVMILNTAYTAEEILLSTCQTRDTWQYLSADLSRYAGREIVLYFEVLNGGGTMNRKTWMYVDDVSLRVPGRGITWLPLVLADTSFNAPQPPPDDAADP
jgi:hypothetical protein